MVRLKAPRGHSSVGFAGAEYEVRDGEVEVPGEAEAALRPHGYNARRRCLPPPRAPRGTAKRE